MSESSVTRSATSAAEDQTLLKKNTTRRRFLLASTAVVGLVGAGVATWPFLASWNPSKRAQAIGGPVSINVSAIKPGTQLTVTWQGKPVWVLRRTPEMLNNLTNQYLLDHLADPYSEVTSQQPEYAQNNARSINPEILVVVAICTHLGCVPLFKPTTLEGVPSDEWMGGYHCPCHNSKFDLAGRVYKFVPAPTNLVIPPYQYLDANTLVIGMDDANRAT